MTLATQLLDGAKIDLTLGNGEAEIWERSTGEIYASVSAQLTLVPGLFVDLAASNNPQASPYGSASWLRNTLPTQPMTEPRTLPGGFSAKRFLVGITMDGSTPGLRGLRSALHWQRSELTELSRASPTLPNIQGLTELAILSPDELMVKDPQGKLANTMEFDTLAFSGSYLILDRFFGGASYQNQHVRSQANLFISCQGWNHGGECLRPSQPSQSLQRQTWSAGLGLILTEGMRASLAWHHLGYDRSYKWFSFRGPNSTRIRQRDVFGLRLAYNWI